jgi:hypothetical protein
MTEYFASHPQASIILTVCVTVTLLVTLFIIAAKFKWLNSFHITKQGIIMTGSRDFEEDQKTQIARLKEIGAAIAADRDDWKERMEGFDRQFEIIKADAACIKTEVQNVYRILADHEEFQEKLSEGTLENMLFNDNVSAFKRLKAYIRLIAMEKNGKIKAKGIDLILNNKEVWEAVLETKKELKLNIVNPEYFREVMKEIDDRVFRY